MQLKRDTEYAVRILFCLKNTINDEADQTGMTLAEISYRTKTSRVITARICDCLKEHGMIHRCRDTQTGEYRFFLTELQLKHSLLDVIEAIEHTGNIFAVFNRESPMYKSCEKEIVRIQTEVETLLASIPLEVLIGGN